MASLNHVYRSKIACVKVDSQIMQVQMQSVFVIFHEGAVSHRTFHLCPWFQFDQIALIKNRDNFVRKS